MKTVAHYIHELAKRLNEHYQDPVLSEQYAWWTLETITGKTGSALLRDKTMQLSPEQEARVQTWVDQLIDQNMPIQYLIGNVPFCGLTIAVKKPILIPRPETEHWCASIIGQLLRYSKDAKPLHILDLCSGTGCIGLAFAQALPNATIVCTDIEQQAVELGQLNAQHNNIDNVRFIRSDLFDNLAGLPFDLVVSNPPYIGEDEFLQLEPSVKNWEDKKALVADDQGFALIKKIITKASAFIRPNDELKQHNLPQLIIEHGSTQSSGVVDLMHKAGYTHVQTHKDLSGKDRVVSGRLPDAAITKKTV